MTFRCKSALKLVELNDRFHIFPASVDTVVDLAAAPGGFAQVAVQSILRSRAKKEQRAPRPGWRGREPQHTALVWRDPLVIAVDARDIEPLDHVRTLKGDVLHHTALRQHLNALLQAQQATDAEQLAHSQSNAAGGTQRQQFLAPRRVQVVLHDGVSVVPGQHLYSVTYAQNHMALAALRLSLELFVAHHAAERLQPPFDPRAVSFVTKTLTSRHMDTLIGVCRRFFGRVAVFKPTATAATSLEQYVVAQGLKLREAEALERGVRRGERHDRADRVGAHLFSLPPHVEDVAAGGLVVWFCFGCRQRRFGTAPCAFCGGT